MRIASEPKLSFLHWLVVRRMQRHGRGKIDVSECFVRPATELVIDGFPGTGNSFASNAFKLSQRRRVALAHHLHSPAQIVKATRLGLPTLVTIREPAAAVLSVTSRWPYLTARHTLRNYLLFYDLVLPFAGGFVLTDFEHTIHHLGRVIEALNARFSTDFTPFEYTEENMRRLRGADRDSKRLAIRAEKSKELQADSCQKLLGHASSLYEKCLSAALL